MEKLKLILRRFLSTLTVWWYNLSPWTNKPILGAFLSQITVFLAALFLMLGIGGCSTVKYVPIQTEEKIVVRDSLIYVRDTVTVEIPREVVKEIVPADTTSILKTSLAMSEARVEEGRLYHSLEQSGEVETEIDTCYITRIEEKIVYKDRPIEVPKEVKHIPTFFWWSLIFNIITVLFIIFKIYLKLKP